MCVCGERCTTYMYILLLKVRGVFKMYYVRTTYYDFSYKIICIISITLDSLLAIHLLSGSSKKILDKNIQAKYLEIGRTQASVIAFQV